MTADWIYSRDREIDAPPPGKAVLMCRCGVALDMADMHRYIPPRRVWSTAAIQQIVCADCAVADLGGVA